MKKSNYISRFLLLKIAPSTFYQYRRENVHNNKKIEIFEKNKISFTLK